MLKRPVAPARFINRDLGEPHETDLGGQAAHHALATAHANLCCPPGGHSIPWDDCYASGEQYPLPLKASLLLDLYGQALPVPDFLTDEKREQFAQAALLAERIHREACRRGIHP